MTSRRFGLWLLVVLLAGTVLLGQVPRAAADEDLSQAFVEAAERIGPSVVAIRTTRKAAVEFRREAPRRFIIPEVPEEFRPYLEEPWTWPFEEPRDRDREGRPQPRIFRWPSEVTPGASVGSGVIYSEEGHIITNDHVVRDAGKVEVTFDDGQSIEAKVVASDPKSDLAVIKVDADRELTPARFGDSDRLRVGQWVLAVGSPFGLKQSVSAGIISGLGRNVGAIRGRFVYESFIQTDAHINHGSSGGPLVDLDGEVVGICIAIASELNLGLTPYPGAGFAIPANRAKTVARQLIERGQVVRGFLGISLQVLPPDEARERGLERRQAVVVRQVVPGSPAERAGFQPDDVILKYQDEEVADLQEFRTRVAATAPGTEVEVVVLRSGEEKTLEVTIGEQPEEPALAGRPVRGDLGLQLQTLTEELADLLGYKGLAGALVTDVEEGSPADEADLAPGDLILEVNKEPVDSAESCSQALRTAEGKALLRVKKAQGEALYVTIQKK